MRDPKMILMIRPCRTTMNLEIVKGVELYIKISKSLKNKPVDCMSFHPAEFPIAYPLKYT